MSIEEVNLAKTDKRTLGELNTKRFLKPTIIFFPRIRGSLRYLKTGLIKFFNYQMGQGLTAKITTNKLSCFIYFSRNTRALIGDSIKIVHLMKNRKKSRFPNVKWIELKFYFTFRCEPYKACIF